MPPRTEMNWGGRDKNRTHKFVHLHRTQTKQNLALFECELNIILSYLFGLHSGFVFGLGFGFDCPDLVNITGLG